MGDASKAVKNRTRSLLVAALVGDTTQNGQAFDVPSVGESCRKISEGFPKDQDARQKVRENQKFGAGLSGPNGRECNAAIGDVKDFEQSKASSDQRMSADGWMSFG